MLDKNVVNDVLTAALSTGGDFAEVFAENHVRNIITMDNGVLEKVASGLEYGVGIRIFNGSSAIYTYSSDTSRENLIKIAKAAAQAIKNDKLVTVSAFTDMKFENNHVVLVMPDTTEKKEIVEMMRTVSAASFAFDPSVTQTSGNCQYRIQDVLIANSDGLWAEDRRVYARMFANAVASSAFEKQDGSEGPGAMMGIEFLRGLDHEDLGRRVAKTAVTMLNASPCPSGKMPVVIDNGFGGVIFHEACAHSLEATSVAKGSSEFCGKLNTLIADPCVTAIDDGTIPNGWGSLNIDDEGTPTQRNVLIENGVLKSYLVDRLNGLKMGMKSTGSSRRQNFKLAPTSRMTNTFIAPGKDKIEDIFASIDNGLYAKKMGGGSVNPATGDFNFAVMEGYLIRNGKAAEPVRGATLIGKGSQVIKDIDMISDNLKRAQGMCGSVSGSVPTDVGQPLLRVKDITVGGRSGK